MKKTKDTGLFLGH